MTKKDRVNIIKDVVVINKHFIKIQRMLMTILILFAVILAGCSEIADEQLLETPSATELPSATESPSATEPSSATEPQNKKPEDYLAGYHYAVINQPSEDFTLSDLEGNAVKLSELQGNIVFLNFWATWCPPCRDEMPHMQTFYEKYQNENVVVLAVNPTQVENRGSSDSKKAEGNVRAYIEVEKFTFPVLLDVKDSVWAMYQQRGIPANYVIDTKGIIRYLKPGAFLSVEEMEAYLAAVRAME